MSTETLHYGRVTWTNIIHPTEEDMQTLSQRYPNFHPLHLHDCLTELEFPKLDATDGYIFLVAQLPRWDGDERICYPSEIDIFLAKGVMVTLHEGNFKPLIRLFASAQTDAAERKRLLGSGDAGSSSIACSQAAAAASLLPISMRASATAVA